MLVLSRHKNEAIVIGHEITVTIVEIRGDKVRLGIEAPKHIAVHRGEVEELVQKEMCAETMKALETTDLTVQMRETRATSEQAETPTEPKLTGTNP